MTEPGNYFCSVKIEMTVSAGISFSVIANRKDANGFNREFQVSGCGPSKSEYSNRRSFRHRQAHLNFDRLSNASLPPAVEVIHSIAYSILRS